MSCLQSWNTIQRKFLNKLLVYIILCMIVLHNVAIIPHILDVQLYYQGGEPLVAQVWVSKNVGLGSLYNFALLKNSSVHEVSPSNNIFFVQSFENLVVDGGYREYLCLYMVKP